MKDESGNLSPATENALHATMALLQPDMTAEEVRDLLEVTEKGQVRNLISNAETILSYDPLLKGAIRFNELTQRVDVVKQLGWDRGSSGAGLTDNDLNNIHLYCERTYGITSQKLIEEAVHIVANRNRFHPVRDFLNSLEWDGTPRIQIGRASCRERVYACV